MLADDGGRQLIEFPEAPPLTIDQMGPALLALDALGITVRQITEADLRTEPRAPNAKMVWACRVKSVHVDDRVRLLDFLSEEGPVALSRAEMRFARGAIAAVLALACADLIEIEIDDVPLGPRTRVRLGSSTPPEQE